MRHFVNFAPPLPEQALPARQGANIGTAIGAVAGLARGAGIGEAEEERKNTTALGRVGKLAGNTLGGAVIGGGTGAAIGGSAKYLKKKAYQASIPNVKLDPINLNIPTYDYDIASK